MAYDRDGSRRSIPVRSAVFGALVGTAGVVAVAVFTHTVTTTIDHPERYGWAFSSVPEVWADGDEAEQMFAPIADEPGIAAVGELRCAPIQLEELTRFACGLEQREVLDEPLDRRRATPDGSRRDRAGSVRDGRAGGRCR